MRKHPDPWNTCITTSTTAAIATITAGTTCTSATTAITAGATTTATTETITVNYQNPVRFH